MAVYHLGEENRTLGSYPIEDAFRTALSDDPRFRMSDADLNALMERRGQMDYGIGGPPAATESAHNSFPLKENYFFIS